MREHIEKFRTFISENNIGRFRWGTSLFFEGDTYGDARRGNGGEGWVPFFNEYKEEVLVRSIGHLGPDSHAWGDKIAHIELEVPLSAFPFSAWDKGTYTAYAADELAEMIAEHDGQSSKITFALFYPPRGEGVMQYVPIVLEIQYRF